MAAETSDTWLSELSAALDKDCDFATLRSLARNRPLTKDLRGRAWKVLLGVSHKPDPFTEWDGTFNLPEQSEIRAACAQLVESLGNDEEDRLALVSDMESIVTLYCKSQKKRFERGDGLIEVLQVMVMFQLPRAELYNVFFAFLTKYIPRDCVKDGRPFDLFRLLLLYHDPQLCSFLDSRKIFPHEYAKSWFNCLFASTFRLDVALQLLDLYLLQADPFQVFFMGLVILLNAKTQIMEMRDRSCSEIAENIRSYPSQLNAADIDDFLQLVSHYSYRTPQSFRRDYHGPLFGSNFTAAFDSITVHSLLCLPVSVQELIRPDCNDDQDSTVRYFVVDARPSAQFKGGHLMGAYNIDASEYVHDLQKFEKSVHEMETFKLHLRPFHHWCFLGSGRDEEDRYVHMVVSHFLKHGTPLVSLVRGGYFALHELLESRLSSAFEGHSSLHCLVCRTLRDKQDCVSLVDEMKVISPSALKDTSLNAAAKSISMLSRLKTVVVSKSSQVKSIVKGYVAGESEDQDPKHVDSSTRHGKPYRSVASVFSISDDESSEEEGNSPSESKSESDLQVVHLKSFLNMPDVLGSFEGRVINDKSENCNLLVVVSNTDLYILHKQDGASDSSAVVRSRHSLGDVRRITSKRHIPELLSFVFECPDEGSKRDVIRLFVPKAGDCAKTVKLAVIAFAENHHTNSTAD